MGIYDSSKTRVAPVFNFLYWTDSTGNAWLPQLLELPERSDGVSPSRPAVSQLVEAHWYPREKTLRPPPALLRALLGSPLARSGGTEVSGLRRALLQGDPEVRAEAARLLEEGQPDRAWYVLEGPTSVDAYLGTAEAVILIEGKRTESGPTTRTTWMAVRHQLLRNLDAAWDRSDGRAPLAFFIVEGKEPDPTAVPADWRGFATATVGDAALAGSLPHRDEGERAAIADAFLGVTTWQRVCAEFHIPWEDLPHELTGDRRLPA